MNERPAHVAMGILFYPRGGSAQVVRYLSQSLESAGWPVRLVSGSLGRSGERTHAPTFFAGSDVVPVAYDAALDAHAAGRDPLAEPVPFHPSFEDRPGMPDRVFAAVSPAVAEQLVERWRALLPESWGAQARLFHLHHLTPLHEAARHRWPDRAIVTNIHGTETKMLDLIERLAAIAAALGSDLATMADRAEAGSLPDPAPLPPEQRALFDDTRWAWWRHGEHWRERLRRIAEAAEGIVVSSPHERDEVGRLLGVSGARVEHIPNGVDTERFDRHELDGEGRLRLWRRWLVEEPRGWDESSEPGTIRYTEEDLRAFVDPRTGGPLPVLLFVGRFLAVKRVQLLVRAYARARARMATPAPLVIWGGFPGECEGEHPLRVAREVGEQGIFFSGWRGHDELPQGLGCADVFVGPSLKEGFGQVFIEAMACGVPVIAARSGGPISFVNTEPGRPNGWLVEPDDLEALAAAIVEAVDDVDARRERAANAYQQVRAAYSWAGLAQRFVELYERAMAAAARRAEGPPAG